MGMQMGRGGGSGMWGAPSWQMRELAKSEKLDWLILRRAIAAFVPYWGNAILVSLVLLITAAGGVIPAYLTQRIIDNGILRGRLSVVIELTLFLILVAVGTGLLAQLSIFQLNFEGFLRVSIKNPLFLCGFNARLLRL